MHLPPPTKPRFTPYPSSSPDATSARISPGFELRSGGHEIPNGGFRQGYPPIPDDPLPSGSAPFHFHHRFPNGSTQRFLDCRTSHPATPLPVPKKPHGTGYRSPGSEAFPAWNRFKITAGSIFPQIDPSPSEKPPFPLLKRSACPFLPPASPFAPSHPRQRKVTIYLIQFNWLKLSPPFSYG